MNWKDAKAEWNGKESLRINTTPFKDNVVIEIEPIKDTHNE